MGEHSGDSNLHCASIAKSAIPEARPREHVFSGIKVVGDQEKPKTCYT